MKSTTGPLQFIAALIFYPLYGFAQKNEEANQVSSALKAIELCVHWHGEEPYDENRAKEIKDGLDQDCPSAKDLAEKIFSKYPNNKSLSVPLIEFNDVGLSLLAQLKNSISGDVYLSLVFVE